MKLKFYIWAMVGCAFCIAVGLGAQSNPQTQQQKPATQPQPEANPFPGDTSSVPVVPATGQQKPATQQQPPAKPPAEANPFPEDTNNVPVVPTTAQPAAEPAPAPETSSGATTSLLKADTDPVHSPDDPPPDTSGDSGFSSSLTGSNDVKVPDEEPPTKHRKLEKPEPVHQETAKEDESVGEFELSRKNWKAALSRFDSAVVTDPENPDVYWGMAEAQRGLGDFSNAKVNYQKVVDYDDPESKHSKDAKKLLKSPQIANAPAVSKSQQPQ